MEVWDFECRLHGVLQNGTGSACKSAVDLKGFNGVWLYQAMGSKRVGLKALSEEGVFDGGVDCR